MAYKNRDWNAYNRDVITKFRAKSGKKSTILLTSTGAKSGLPRTTPLIYTTDGDRLIIIASKGGAPAHPDWYYNLIANPEASVELGTERFQVRATVAAEPERERLYTQMAKSMPFFTTYQKNATRQIPVFILERIE